MGTIDRFQVLIVMMGGVREVVELKEEGFRTDAGEVHETQLATMKSRRFDQRLITFIICCWTLFIL